MTVTHIWSILAGPDSENWQEWGPLEADHLWRYEFKEKVEQESDEEGEVERGDFGEFAEDDSDSEPEEYEIFEPEDDPESDEFYVNCAGWIARSNSAGQNPIGVGGYFPQNVQIRSGQYWPEPRYWDSWQQKHWLRNGVVHP